MAESSGPHRGGAPPDDGFSAGRSVFPQTEEEFNDDIRVSFDRANNKYLLEDENGKEYEWNATYKKWIEPMDEALLEQQASAYKFANVDENEPAANNSKKRKGADDGATDKPKKAKKEPEERINTSVYVTGLPLDLDVEDVEEKFKRHGVLAVNVDSQTPKIKMYADDSGAFKGEALVSYFRPESVAQAIYMLDETDFHTSGSGSMRVQEADMSFKRQKEVPTGPDAAKARGKRRDVEKIKEITKMQNARLADWDDDDPSTIKTRQPSKWDHFVVVKHAFTQKEIEEDPAVIMDVKDDMRDEGEKFGEITNTIVYDLEPDGVVTIRFKDPDAATACAAKMNGRVFGGPVLEAYVPTTNERFRKSPNRDNNDEEHK